MKTLSDEPGAVERRTEQLTDDAGPQPEVPRTVYVADPDGLARMNTGQLRNTFLVEDLFRPGKLTRVGSDLDRAVIGAAAPQARPLCLGKCGEPAGAYFTERRELGVINIGAAGLIKANGTTFAVGSREMVYIGRGNPEIIFCSRDERNPAMFYFVSYPAHATYPTRYIPREQAQSVHLGSRSTANERTIVKCIQPPFVQSCQLIMGFTELAEGSVWNTMPTHLHPRRSEIYMYFALPQDGIVLHCLGKPQETRHIVVRNHQAVFSPSWSIHSGVGTTSYSFVWAMGGENQEFSDVEPIPMTELA